MLPEEKDVSVETEQINDGKVSMEKEESETSEASPAEGTEAQDASGKDVKTTPKEEVSEEGSEDKEMEEALKSGQPIPYERFKKWNDGKNAIKSRLETLEADNEEMAGLFDNPTIFRAVLQAKGITDPKILSQKMKEAGFEEQEEIPKKELFKQLSEGVDLTTREGWFEMMERMFKHFSKEAISPIERKINEKEIQSYVLEQESEAKKLAKDVYSLEYGVAGRDEGNPNTAVGKMAAYLDKHPEDARLGHVKILRLALADEGIKLGEKKGLQKEKDRQKNLKASAMEDDAQAIKEGTPDSSWSVSEIMAWRRKYGK